MIRVEDVISGSGRSWFMKDVSDRAAWLIENINVDDYILKWNDLHSDIMIINFKRKEDATAYKLRWM